MPLPYIAITQRPLPALNMIFKRLSFAPQFCVKNAQPGLGLMTVLRPERLRG